MSRLFFSIGMSLDGFIAGPNSGPGNPLGDRGIEIHEWAFRQKNFLDGLELDNDGETGADNKLVGDIFGRTGAYIMGKRMFEEGEANWPENPPFHAPVYVMTHKPQKPWKRKGGTTFYFITNGMQNALAKARIAAGNKDIRISGGADTLQQFLNAGLIDEGIIHLAPVLLGSGLRLFENLDLDHFAIEIVKAENSNRVTHLYCKTRSKH